MAQYTTGTVTTIAGSNIVTGSGTAWLTSVSAGDEFKVAGDPTFYTISSVDLNTQLTLTANYHAANTAASYEINTDFTTNLGLPLPNQGDAALADTVSRIAELVDAAVGLGLTFLGSVIDKDLNAASTTGLTDGDSYIVASGVASGDAWYGYVGYIATWDSTTSTWGFTTPDLGDFVLVVDEGKFYVFDGSVWNELTLTVNYGSYITTFDNGDLAAGVLTVTHNLGQKCVNVTIMNNSSNDYIGDVTFVNITSLAVDFTVFGALTGTWTILCTR